MALRPLYGHRDIRLRLAAAAHHGRLPASVLLAGPRGVGKQRLALWLAQLLVCDRAVPDKLTEPCGTCPQCRYSIRLVHPDVHWFFPRPKLANADPSYADVAADLGETIAERVDADGLWEPSSGSDGLHIATIRALVHAASVRPAMSSRAVFVVGDAERMVSQEGSDQAANTFLKLLEEPPPGTTLILTSSEPGSLLPTIRSRVVSIRIAPMPRVDVDAFLADAAVQKKLGAATLAELASRAGGAPGTLIGAESTSLAFASAKRLLDAALQPTTPAGTTERVKSAARLGVAGARGAFSDMLDALTVLLHARVRALVASEHESDARRTAMAIIHVEHAKLRAHGNVSPQLLGASLIGALHHTLRP